VVFYVTYLPGVFWFRGIQATAMNCLIIAGASFLLLIPLPSFLAVPAAVGLAVYLTMHYTGVELFPDGLLIPVGIECVFYGAYWFIQESGVLR
jgi:hypothetical protein